MEETLRAESLKSGYQAEPIEKNTKSARSNRKQDPYVVKAMERAKVKIRDRIFHLNGGHIN